MSNQLVQDGPILYVMNGCVYSIGLVRLILRFDELKKIVKIADVTNYPSLGISIIPSLDPRDGSKIRQGKDCFMWLMDYGRKVWGDSLSKIENIANFEMKIEEIYTKAEEVSRLANKKVPKPKSDPDAGVAVEGSNGEFVDATYDGGKTAKELRKNRSKRVQVIPSDATAQELREAEKMSLIVFDQKKQGPKQAPRKKEIVEFQTSNESLADVKSALFEKSKSTKRVVRTKKRERRAYGTFIG